MMKIEIKLLNKREKNLSNQSNSFSLILNDL